MKNNKIFIALCFSAIAFCACETDNREDMTASLEYRKIKVNEHTLNLSADGTEKEFSITANNTTWSVESPDEWIHIDPEKGSTTTTIKVTADKCTNPDAGRDGMIIVKSTVTGWNFADTVYVNQDAAEHYAKAAEEVYEVPAKGGELIIPVDANCKWTASSSVSWATVEKISQTQLKAIIKPTTSTYTRSVTISLKDSTSYYSLSNFEIKQAAPEIKVAQEVYEVPAKGGELIIPVDANCKWTASSSVSWATVEKISQTQLKAIIKPTTSTYTRSVTISLKDSTSYYSLSNFEIKQAAPEIKVAQEVYEVPAKGGELIIPVEADVEWKASSDKDWVKFEKISNSQLRVIVNQTKYTSATEAKISFSLAATNTYSNGTITSFKIKQEAPIIKAEKKSYDMPAKGGMILVNVEADVNWVAAASYTYDWITFEHYSDTQVAVIADPTPATGTRTAYFDLKLPGNTYKMDSFSVTQEAGTISVSETDFRLSKDAHSLEVTVEANTNWNVEIGNPTMVSVSQTKGEAGRTKLTITVEKTSTYRSSKVYLRIGNNRVREINIFQQ